MTGAQSAVTTALTAPRIKVNGTELSAQVIDRITSLKVDLALNMTGRGVIRFDDAGYVVSSDTGNFGAGGEIEIGAGTVTVFSGEITGVELVHHRGLVDFVVTFDDKTYKMGLGNQVRTFLQQTASDIVSTIAREYGLQAAVDSTTEQIGYLIEAGSDLELLNALAENEGYDWWVSGGTLNFKAPAGGTEVSVFTLDDDMIDFSVRATAIHPGATTVSGWAVSTKQQLSNTASGTSTELNPDAALVTGFVSASDLSSFNSLLDASRSPASQSSATSMSTSLAQRWVTQAVTARGTVPMSPAVVLGAAVGVANAGPSSGKYIVTELQHSYSASGFITRFVSGDRRPARLVDSLGGDGRRAPQLGLMVGVVTQVSTESGSAAAMVKLKFPALSDAVESNWARVATVGGGPSRGVTFLPEVNDEVLVGFEQGDLTRPVVLGGLFNGRDSMADSGVESGAVNRRRITSRTGHSIELGDGTGNANLYIALALAGAQHTIKMSKEALDITVPNNLPVSIKAGNNGIVFDNQGNITIQGQKIVLKATQDVEIAGLNVTTKANVKAETSATQLMLKANATAELSAGGITSVKGAMVAIN